MDSLERYTIENFLGEDIKSWNVAEEDIKNMTRICIEICYKLDIGSLYTKTEDPNVFLSYKSKRKVTYDKFYSDLANSIRYIYLDHLKTKLNLDKEYKSYLQIWENVYTPPTLESSISARTTRKVKVVCKWRRIDIFIMLHFIETYNHYKPNPELLGVNT